MIFSRVKPVTNGVQRAFLNAEQGVVNKTLPTNEGFLLIS